MNKQTLYYVTGNQNKFMTAQMHLQAHGIDLQQKALEIPEIQASSTDEVALDKAVKAYELVRAPLVVSDHGWHIAALNGFPGPYMKYVNHWFAPEDFLALVKNHGNREVTLRQNLIYIDSDGTQPFAYDLKGYVLAEAYAGEGTSWDKVVCITGDGKSISEARKAAGQQTILSHEPEPWLSFAQWYLSRQTKALR